MQFRPKFLFVDRGTWTCGAIKMLWPVDQSWPHAFDNSKSCASQRPKFTLSAKQHEHPDNRCIHFQCLRQQQLGCPQAAAGLDRAAMKVAAAKAAGNGRPRFMTPAEVPRSPLMRMQQHSAQSLPPQYGGKASCTTSRTA